MKTYYVYMMTNKSRTVLYTGVTNGLTKRAWQHREGKGEGFTSRYNCTRLVYYEAFRGIDNAIAREKEIKGWRRAKKNKLVESMNPRWNDLSVSVLGLSPPKERAWRWVDQDDKGAGVRDDVIPPATP